MSSQVEDVVAVVDANEDVAKSLALVIDSPGMRVPRIEKTSDNEGESTAHWAARAVLDVLTHHEIDRVNDLHDLAPASVVMYVNCDAPVAFQKQDDGRYGVLGSDETVAPEMLPLPLLAMVPAVRIADSPLDEARAEAQSELDDLRAQVEHYRRACHEYERDAEVILAPALGYPPFEPGSPGYTEGRVNYSVGDHVAQTLMAEAASRLAEQAEPGPTPADGPEEDFCCSPQGCAPSQKDDREQEPRVRGSVRKPPPATKESGSDGVIERLRAARGLAWPALEPVFDHALVLAQEARYDAAIRSNALMHDFSPDYPPLVTLLARAGGEDA